MRLYSGVDLHSNNGMYVISDEQDRIVLRKRLPNDLGVVLATLAPYREQLVAVAVESTYNWYWLVDGLQENGYQVKLANPAAIVQYRGLKHVDDETDATFLAHLLRLGLLPEGYILAKAERSVRDVLRRRMLLVKHRTAQILSVQNLLAREGQTARSWRRLARLTAEELDALLKHDPMLMFTVRQQTALIGHLTEQIRQFEKRVLEQVKLRPEYELLLTVPGIGMILALTIMLETGPIGRFAAAGNYTSYSRCAGARRWTNGKVKGQNNAKCGNRYLSWAYVEAVHQAVRCCEPARRWYQRKAAATCGAVATKALASKWTKAVSYMLRRQEPFDLKRVFG